MSQEVSQTKQPPKIFKVNFFISKSPKIAILFIKSKLSDNKIILIDFHYWKNHFD